MAKDWTLPEALNETHHSIATIKDEADPCLVRDWLTAMLSHPDKVIVVRSAYGNGYEAAVENDEKEEPKRS